MFFSFSRTWLHHKAEEKRFTYFDNLQTFRIMYNLHNLKKNYTVQNLRTEKIKTKLKQYFAMFDK